MAAPPIYNRDGQQEVEGAIKMAVYRRKGSRFWQGEYYVNGKPVHHYMGDVIGDGIEDRRFAAHSNSLLPGCS